VDEVLPDVRAAAQLAVGAALAFSPCRFISGVGKGVALEERVDELGSGPSGLRSRLSFFLFLKIHLGCQLATTDIIFCILRISATIADT
jgi:hypothetical protein